MAASRAAYSNFAVPDAVCCTLTHSWATDIARKLQSGPQNTSLYKFEVQNVPFLEVGKAEFMMSVSLGKRSCFFLLTLHNLIA